LKDLLAKIERVKKEKETEDAAEALPVEEDD
jgi:hypothetical protein